MEVSVIIDGVVVNVIAEHDGHKISFQFPGGAPRRNIRSTENKYMKSTVSQNLIYMLI